VLASIARLPLRVLERADPAASEATQHGYASNENQPSDKIASIIGLMEDSLAIRCAHARTHTHVPCGLEGALQGVEAEKVDCDAGYRACKALSYIRVRSYQIYA
jgi:hypothetical protein